MGFSTARLAYVDICATYKKEHRNKLRCSFCILTVKLTLAELGGAVGGLQAVLIAQPMGQRPMGPHNFFHLLGRNEFAWHQGFAAQNAWQGAQEESRRSKGAAGLTARQ